MAKFAIGPVWVDMFYSWKARASFPPDMKLVLPSPGMPGKPMHYTIPAKAPHKDLAEKFVNLATSTEVQAKGIVERFKWYRALMPACAGQLDKATWDKLFNDISPDDLARTARRSRLHLTTGHSGSL